MRRCVFLSGLSSALAHAGAASAQHLYDPQSQYVFGEDGPSATQARGFRLGSLQIYPSVDVETRYDSNVFARSQEKTDDFVLRVGPKAVVEADWGRSKTVLRLGATASRHADFESQNREDFSLALNSEGGLGRSSGYVFGVAYDSRAAVRGTAENDFTSGEPIPIRNFSTTADFTRDIGPLGVSLGVSADIVDFGDAELESGGVSQEFRDRTLVAAKAAIGFAPTGNLVAFVRGQLAQTDYADDDSPANRDGGLKTVQVGARYQVSELITAEIAAGVRRTEFDNELYSDFSGLSLNGRLSWRPTPLIAVGATVAQTTTTSAFDQVQAVTTTSGRLSANYEFLRNLSFRASGEIALEDYENLNFTAERYSVEVAAIYKLNRRAALRFFATARQRDASASAALINDFNEINAGVGLTLSL